MLDNNCDIWFNLVCNKWVAIASRMFSISLSYCGTIKRSTSQPHCLFAAAVTHILPQDTLRQPCTSQASQLLPGGWIRLLHFSLHFVLIVWLCFSSSVCCDLHCRPSRKQCFSLSPRIYLLSPVRNRWCIHSYTLTVNAPIITDRRDYLLIFQSKVPYIL